MTRPECQTLRDKLHGYRLGEGTPLERQKLELHLKKCAGCNNELYLLHELELAARSAPPALNDGDKRNILNNIYRTLRQEDGAVLELRQRFNWRKWFAFPAAAIACAAALMVVLSNPAQQAIDSQIDTSTPSVATNVEVQTDIAPVLVVDKPLEVGPGVVAFQSGKAKTLVRSKGSARSIDLNQGAMVAEFNRQKDQEPLEIITPHARVVIRGTVFAVNTSLHSTTVAVNRGKVEVHAKNGEITLLQAGESIEIGQAPETIPEKTEPLQVAMTSHFGEQPPAAEEKIVEEPQAGLVPSPAQDASSEPVVETPPTPPPARSAAKRKRKAAKKVLKKTPAQTEAASAMELLRSARTLWRKGEHGLAIQALESVLSGDGLASLESRERDEARYLLATIHRDLGDYGRAANTLRILSQNAESLTARMARLELARLEARHLGNLDNARNLLEALVAEDILDMVTEEGLFELCALYIKGSQWLEAKSCLHKFIAKFGQSERTPEARSLLDNLPELR